MIHQYHDGGSFQLLGRNWGTELLESLHRREFVLRRSTFGITSTGGTGIAVKDSAILVGFVPQSIQGESDNS